MTKRAVLSALVAVTLSAGTGVAGVSAGITRTSEADTPVTFTAVTSFEQAKLTLPLDGAESTLQDRTTVALTDSGADAVAASIVPVRMPAAATATRT